MTQQPLGVLGRLIYRGFTIIIFRHTTVGRTPLDEWSTRRRVLYLTTHNTHRRQTSMPSAGFFFFACPGFFPFDPFLYCIKSFCPSCHFTFHTTVKHNTNIHAPGGIRTHNPSKRAAEDPRLRPHGHRDRRILPLTGLNLLEAVFFLHFLYFQGCPTVFLWTNLYPGKAVLCTRDL
jgi:hypothetical protein